MAFCFDWKLYNRVKEDYWMSEYPLLVHCLKFIFKVCDTLYINAFLRISFFLIVIWVLIKNFKSKLNRHNRNETPFIIWILSGLLSKFGTIFIGIGISISFRPMFMDRYLFPVALIVGLIWGVSIENLTFKKTVAVMIVAFIFSGSIPTYLSTYKEEKEQNKLCQETVSKMNMVSRNNILLTDFSHFNWTTFDYYFPETPHKLINENKLELIDKNQNYFLVITHELDDEYINWIKASGMTYNEICLDGVIGCVSVNVYELKRG